MASAGANIHTGLMGIWVPQFDLAFSASSVASSEETEEAEEAPIFGRGSSLVLQGYTAACCRGFHLTFWGFSYKILYISRHLGGLRMVR